jgi:streptomycin 6-kinase
MIQKSLEYYLSIWHLVLEEDSLQTPTGLIAKVQWNDKPCILKISQNAGDERTAPVLSHYDGMGAVKLMRSEGHASLLERAIPGTPLSELVFKEKDEKATRIICEVIQKLHSHQESSGVYLLLEDLGKGFQKYLKSGDQQIPRHLVDEAKMLYEKLVKTQNKPILLHGDLHHDNVLYDKTRGWLAIDPKGYIGEPAYEVGAFLRNPLKFPDLYQDLSQLNCRLDIICQNLGFNRERVIGWAFSQAVLAGVWCVENGSSPNRMVELARLFKEGF